MIGQEATELGGHKKGKRHGAEGGRRAPAKLGYVL